MLIDATKTKKGGGVFLPAWNWDSVGQGSWAKYTDANYLYNGYVKSNPALDSDSLDFKAFISAGTYSLKFMSVHFSIGGIVDIDIDGLEVASFDLYQAATERNKVQTATEITVSASTVKTITVRLDGKHASSSGYSLIFQYLHFYRTA